jgi:nucleoside-diphosphate-sugar epimerase
MRILITGSKGFVGQHVVRELKDKHELWTPTREELNLLEVTPGEMECDLFHRKIDAIVHLAATCGGIGINKDNPGRFIYENLQIGINVLEAAREAKISKVVNLGTVCAYPKYTTVPFQEQDIWNGYPEETNAPYGIAKKTIMEMGIAYSRQYGMNITNLVPANMAGEYDHFDEYSSHVIPAIIKKFENPLVDDTGRFGISPCGPIKYVELWGSGGASREFLNAKDCARAIEVALRRSTGPDPINLGTGQEIIIRDLAGLIKKIGDYDASIVWDISKPDGQPRRCLDVTRAKEILQWEATIPLEQTIREAIEWYRHEYLEH